MTFRVVFRHNKIIAIPRMKKMVVFGRGENLDDVEFINPSDDAEDEYPEDLDPKKEEFFSENQEADTVSEATTVEAAELQAEQRRKRKQLVIRSDPINMFSHRQMNNLLKNLKLPDYEDDICGTLKAQHLMMQTWLDDPDLRPLFETYEYEAGSPGQTGHIVYPRAKIFLRLLMSYLLWAFKQQQDLQIPDSDMSNFLENTIVVCLGAHEYTNQLQWIYDFYTCLGLDNGPYFILMDVDPNFDNMQVDEQHSQFKEKIRFVRGKATVQKMASMSRKLRDETNKQFSTFVFSDMRSDILFEEVDVGKHLFLTWASQYHFWSKNRFNRDRDPAEQRHMNELVDLCCQALRNTRQKQLALESIIERDWYFQMKCAGQGVDVSVKDRPTFDYKGPMGLNAESADMHNRNFYCVPRMPAWCFARKNSSEQSCLAFGVRLPDSKKEIKETLLTEKTKPFNEEKISKTCGEIEKQLQRRPKTQEDNHDYASHFVQQDMTKTASGIIIVKRDDRIFAKPPRGEPEKWYTIRQVERLETFWNQAFDKTKFGLFYAEQLVLKMRDICNRSQEFEFNQLGCLQQAQHAKQVSLTRAPFKNPDLDDDTGAFGKMTFSQKKAFIDQQFDIIAGLIDATANYEQTKENLTRILPNIPELRGHFESVRFEDLIPAPRYFNRPILNSWKLKMSRLKDEGTTAVWTDENGLDVMSDTASGITTIILRNAKALFMSLQRASSYHIEQDTLETIHPHLANEDTLTFVLDLKYICSRLDQLKEPFDQKVNQVVSGMIDMFDDDMADRSAFVQAHRYITDNQRIYRRDKNVLPWVVVASALQLCNSHNIRTQSQHELTATRYMLTILSRFVIQAKLKGWFQNVKAQQDLPYHPMSISRYHRGLTLKKGPAREDHSDSKRYAYLHNFGVTTELYRYVMTNLPPNMTSDEFFDNYNEYIVSEGLMRFKTHISEPAKNFLTWPGALPTAHCMVHAPNVFTEVIKRMRLQIDDANVFRQMMSTDDRNRMNMLRRAAYYGYVGIVKFLLQHDDLKDLWNVDFAALYFDALEPPASMPKDSLRGKAGYYTIIDDAELNIARCEASNDKKMHLPKQYPHKHVYVVSTKAEYVQIKKSLEQYAKNNRAQELERWNGADVSESKWSKFDISSKKAWLFSTGPFLRDQWDKIKVDDVGMYSVTPACISHLIMESILKETASLPDKRIHDACGGVGGDLSMMMCHHFDSIMCTELDAGRFKMIEDNVALLRASCRYAVDDVRLENFNCIRFIENNDDESGMHCNILYIDPPWENYNEEQGQFMLTNEPLSIIVKLAFDHGYKFVFIKLPASDDNTTKKQLEELQYKLPTFEIRQSQLVKSKRMSLMIIKKPLTDT